MLHCEIFLGPPGGRGQRCRRYFRRQREMFDRPEVSS